MPLTNTIRQHREAADKTLRELAEAVGMDWAHLSRVERGKGACSDEKKIALARYFDVPVGALFFGELVASTATD